MLFRKKPVVKQCVRHPFGNVHMDIYPYKGTHIYVYLLCIYKHAYIHIGIQNRTDSLLLLGRIILRHWIPL